jgi:hypothetical protein
VNSNIFVASKRSDRPKPRNQVTKTYVTTKRYLEKVTSTLRRINKSSRGVNNNSLLENSFTQVTNKQTSQQLKTLLVKTANQENTRTSRSVWDPGGETTKVVNQLFIRHTIDGWGTSITRGCSQRHCHQRNSKPKDDPAPRYPTTKDPEEEPVVGEVEPNWMGSGGECVGNLLDSQQPTTGISHLFIAPAIITY